MDSTDIVRISTDNLNENHIKIIQYIEERGIITNKEVQNLLNLVQDSTRGYGIFIEEMLDIVI